MSALLATLIGAYVLAFARAHVLGDDSAETGAILDGSNALNADLMSEPDRIHVIVEAMRRAYNDRARFMGDQDFVDVPVARLASKAYAQERAQSIDLYRATPSSELPSIYDVAKEGTAAVGLTTGPNSSRCGWPWVARPRRTALCRSSPAVTRSTSTGAGWTAPCSCARNWRRTRR